MPGNLYDVLNARAMSTSASKGSLLFRSGDKASAVYVIRKGRVALVWTGSNGVHPMDTLGPGSIIGLPGAFNGEYSMAARAVEDSELGMIPVDKLMGLLESNPDLMRPILEILAKDVAKMRAMLGKAPKGKRLRLVVRKPKD